MKNLNASIQRVVIALFLSLFCVTTVFSAEKPNVIVILVDDMGWADSETYGSEYYKTPNLTRLANEGMKFTNAYAASPLCSPTRASIMSGQYPARLRLTLAITAPDVAEPQATAPQANWNCGNVQSKNHMPLEVYTLAEILKDNGYSTAHIGKWHLTQSGLGDTYNAEKQGFDYVIGGDHLPGPPDYYSPYKNSIPNLSAGPDGEYLNERLAQESIDWITSVKDNGKPFFLNFWYYAVHGPIIAKQDLMQKYTDTRNPDADQRCPEMGTMLESMDNSIGVLLNWLDLPANADLKANTVIILTSDNGGVTHEKTVNGDTWTSNRPLRGGKANTYEGGVREPWIVRWMDNTPAGSVCHTAIQSTDIYPTLLDIANISPAEGQVLDGRSIVPLLKGETMADVPIFTDFPHRFGTLCAPSATVRLGDWKLLRYYWAGEGAKSHYYELFNLKKDSMETINLAAYYPEKITELDALITQHLTDVDALIPIQNPNYTGVSPFIRGTSFPETKPRSVSLPQTKITFEESGSDTIQLVDEKGIKRKTFAYMVEGEEWLGIENTFDGKVIVSWDADKKDGMGKVLFGWSGGATTKEINDWTFAPCELVIEKQQRPGGMITDGSFDELFTNYWVEQNIATSDANISYSTTSDSVKVTLNADAAAWYSHGFYNKQQNALEFGDTVYVSFSAKSSVEGAQLYTIMNAPAQTIGGIPIGAMTAGTYINLSTEWKRYETYILIGGDNVNVASRDSYQFKCFFQDAATYVVDSLDVYINEKPYSPKTSLIDNGEYNYVNTSTWLKQANSGGVATMTINAQKEQEVNVTACNSSAWYSVHLQNKRLSNLGANMVNVNVSFVAKASSDNALITPVMNSAAYDGNLQYSALGNNIEVGQNWQRYNANILLGADKTEGRENWKFIMAFGSVANYTIDSVEVYTLKQEDLRVSALGNGTTTPASGTHFFLKNEEVDLLAKPNAGSQFIKWIIDGKEILENPITVLVDKSKSAYAVFTGGNVVQYATASAQVYNGERTADNANDGNTADWSGWTGKIGSGASCWLDFTWDSPQIFNRVVLYSNSNLNYNIDGYTIQYWDGSAYQDAATVSDNIQVQVTSTFQSVTTTKLRILCTDPEGSTPEGFYRVEEVEAYYDSQELTMQASSGNGSVNPEVGEYTYGKYDDVILSALADNGWSFSKWLVNGVNIFEDSVTVAISDTAVSAKAFFVEQKELLISKEGNGVLSPEAGTHHYNVGEEVKLIATAEEGWLFQKWIVDGQDIMEDTTIISINADLSATAVFSIEARVSELSSFNIKIVIDPRSEQFNILADKLYKFELFDLSGKVIYEQTMQKKHASFDISHLQDGVYVVRLSHKNEVHTKKIIK